MKKKEKERILMLMHRDETMNEVKDTRVGFIL